MLVVTTGAGARERKDLVVKTEQLVRPVSLVVQDRRLAVPPPVPLPVPVPVPVEVEVPPWEL